MSFMDVDSGEKLPMCHCAFKGYTVTTNQFDAGSHWGQEKWLFDPLVSSHKHTELKEVWEEICSSPQEAIHASEISVLQWIGAL